MSLLELLLLNLQKIRCAMGFHREHLWAQVQHLQLMSVYVRCEGCPRERTASWDERQEAAARWRERMGL